VPADGALSGAYSAVEQLIGTSTSFPVQAGEQVTSFKISRGVIANKDDVSLTLAPGMRAVGVEVSEVTGVGGLLLPGNFVDVIAVFPSAPAGVDGNAIENVKSVTLLQNIEVLAVAQEAQEPVPVASDAEAAGPRGQRPDGAERQPDAQSATLAVSPQDAQMLALVHETGGVIWLSLRPAGDQDTPSPEESNLLRFFSRPPAPEPGF
jgi:pilus assembly protein CpaB